MSPFSGVRIFSLYVWLIDTFIDSVKFFYLGAHPSIVELSLFTCNAVSSLASESAPLILNSPFSVYLFFGTYNISFSLLIFLKYFLCVRRFQMVFSEEPNMSEIKTGVRNILRVFYNIYNTFVIVQDVRSMYRLYNYRLYSTV